MNAGKTVMLDTQGGIMKRNKHYFFLSLLFDSITAISLLRNDIPKCLKLMIMAEESICALNP